MANTYVINPPLSTGDQLFITGSVNGVQVSVMTWVSVAGSALASVITWENFATALMLEAYQALQPPSTSYPALGNSPITVTK